MVLMCGYSFVNGAKHCSIKCACNQYSFLAISANFVKKIRPFCSLSHIYVYRLYRYSKGCIDTIDGSLNYPYIAVSINRCRPTMYTKIKINYADV